ncbi:MAG: hypothetical protein VXZ58_08390 [Actinomycetota bacterium]|nr:hypothetical protein [Actinomycetota bacterium]
MANTGLHSIVPVFWNTNVVLIARKNAILLQIMGKAVGGGCHQGPILLKTRSDLEALGLELSRGENTLERTLEKSITINTTNVCKSAGEGTCDISLSGNPEIKKLGTHKRFKTPICNTCKNTRTKENCVKVAPT